MRTYRQLFAIAEFRALFFTRCLVMISVSAGSLALGSTLFAETGSTVLTALAVFGGPLVSLFASHFLLAASDLVRPRTALMWQIGVPAVTNSFQVIPGLSWPIRFVLLAIPYLVNSAFSGTQWAIMREIVTDDGYVLARATINLAVGGMQLVGFGLGGLALVWIAPQELFAAAAVSSMLGLLLVRLRIRDRPARATGESVLRRSRTVNRTLLSSSTLRPIYLAMWVPNGLVAGAEALYIPYAAAQGHPSLSGYLFAASAGGMMLGDLTVGRFLSTQQRGRLLLPLRLVLAAPYVLFAFALPPLLALGVVFAASVGYAASLVLQECLVTATADRADVSGQVLGLAGQGLMIGQAVGALLAGGLAQHFAAGSVMAGLGAASVVATLALGPSLARSRTAVAAGT